jgi:hypothetical protein
MDTSSKIDDDDRASLAMQSNGRSPLQGPRSIILDPASSNGRTQSPKPAPFNLPLSQSPVDKSIFSFLLTLAFRSQAYHTPYIVWNVRLATAIDPGTPYLA